MPAERRIRLVTATAFKHILHQIHINLLLGFILQNIKSVRTQPVTSFDKTHTTRYGKTRLRGLTAVKLSNGTMLNFEAQLNHLQSGYTTYTR